ncbi:MAG: hypothetical protein AAFR74_07865 [Pseudomonadota bacterium]
MKNYLSLLSALLAFVILTSCQRSEAQRSLPIYIGEWDCMLKFDAEPKERSQLWAVSSDGLITAKGSYPAGHPSGIEGEYVSVSQGEFREDHLIETLLDYDLINPTRNGIPLSEEEERAFEKAVEKANPVRYDYKALRPNAYFMASEFARRTCDRL